MSENLELFHRAVSAMNRQDLDAFAALMDDEVEAVPRLAAMEGRYHGPAGIRRWWEGLYGVFPDLSIEVPEVRDLGDVTVAEMRLRGRGVGSDTPVDESVWHLAWWQGGKCTRWGIYGTEAQALEAVSLAE